MTFRFATTFVSTLALLGALPLFATPDSPDAALVALDVERDGEPVFAPRILVKLDRMSEASMEAPSGEGHRILLSVTRDKDFYRLRSLYLTRDAGDRWVVQAEPQVVFRGDAPASMTLADDASEFQLRFNVSVGDASDLTTRMTTVAAGRAEN